jgi:glyoxylase-like metal-dependent hydrolase (beta-lactamase superfamily II)
MQVGPFEFLHMPGHCAGQVVIRLHDVLFSGDHILADISPHMAPERLVLNTGLEHYLNSLSLLKKSSAGIRLTLPGHNGPISNLNARIDEIVDIHKGRLGRVADILSRPGTISEVSRQLFPNVHGYNELLALEEAGAHVEYLYQRGALGIKNLDGFLQGYAQTPIQYHRI